MIFINDVLIHQNFTKRFSLNQFNLAYFSILRQDVEQHSMENILTDTRQLNKDNNLLKMELENRIQDLATQNKTGGDNKASKQYNYSMVSIEGF